MEIVRQLLGMVMPGSCLLCESPLPTATVLCSGCLFDLPEPGRTCPGCGRKQSTGNLCGRCQSRKPPYDGVVVGYEYAYPVDHLIRAFKYRGSLLVARALTPALVQQIRSQSEDMPQALLPVPLHYSRLYQRGFNQSLELTKRLARELTLPVDARLLQRHRATREQAQLGPKERRRNLRAAFSLKRANPYQSAAIVDDVITTGTTAAELARLLRRSGTKQIQIWALARANSN